jgi:hypothetical protein
MQGIKRLYERFERHFLTIVFIGGFVLDNLTLSRVDRLFDNLVLSLYLFIAGATIFIWNKYETTNLTNVFLVKTHGALPAITQFCFGALFSGFVVFYSKGGLLVDHLPFLLFLIALFIGNEYFRSFYSRLTFQLSIFFVSTFLYSIFILPVIIRTVNSFVFLLSGILSLLIFGLLFFMIAHSAPLSFRTSKRSIILTTICIYGLINVLYFTNSIPPLPLTLKDIGVYHEVTRAIDSYTVTYERNLFRFFSLSEPFHKVSGESVYVFSSVFAPTKLSTGIAHEWFFYDTSESKWVSTGRISFPIVGGRDGGYRGYSVKSNPSPGKWRVDVITTEGRIIGRMRFTVIESSTQNQLVQKVK